jgi:hypothetical protein
MGEQAVREGFQQAELPVKDAQRFEELRGRIERVFASDVIEKFLSKLQSKRLRARQFEEILDRGLLDQFDPQFGNLGTTAQQMFTSLPLSDQGQIREFYLTRVEQVDWELRNRFHKVYQYY